MRKYYVYGSRLVFLFFFYFHSSPSFLPSPFERGLYVSGYLELCCHHVYVYVRPRLASFPFCFCSVDIRWSCVLGSGWKFGGGNARPQDRSCMILFVCFFLEGRAWRNVYISERK